MHGKECSSCLTTRPLSEFRSDATRVYSYCITCEFMMADKKLSGKTRRFRRDCDHVLSKHLVRSVEPGATLVFEDLTDIRSRVKARKEQRRRLHSWSFHQLQAFTVYKAQARGVTVVYVDPRYTSQKCAVCGHRERANRQSQEHFCCKACGHQANADVNAAINIRANHLLTLGCPVNQPIVSMKATA